MLRVILFLVISCSALLTVVTIEQCKSDGSDDCVVFPWRSWGSCIGNCGHQKQNRKRFFCCNVNVRPHNLENCLLYCNLSNAFETFQNQTCRVCKNGGTVLSASSPCVCGSQYRGDCCEGKYNSESLSFVDFIHFFCKESIDMSFSYFTNPFCVFNQTYLCFIDSLMRPITNIVKLITGVVACVSYFEK